MAFWSHRKKMPKAVILKVVSKQEVNGDVGLSS